MKLSALLIVHVTVVLALLAVSSGLLGCSDSGAYQGQEYVYTSSDSGAPDGSEPVACRDEDGDGIADDIEGEGDEDGDGLANRVDPDSDGDGIVDERERGAARCAIPVDSDLDGIADYRDPDSDNDGIGDAGRDPDRDLDRDGKADYRDMDDDGDNIGDAEEIGDNPLKPLDSDGDGIPDYQDEDSNNDGIKDTLLAGVEDLDGDGIVDYRDRDADGDGIPNTIEIGDDPTEPLDTDGDGAPDYIDADSDNDGLADGFEDKNHNGETDSGESDRLKMDTDGDGADDMVEFAAGTDGTDPDSNPTAEGNFVFVVPYEQDPEPQDATLDFATDVVQADLVFSIDTTGSMSGEIDGLRTALQTEIVPALAGEIPDLAFGLADYRDYPIDPFGNIGDYPYRLDVPVTTDVAQVQEALNGLMAEGGGDEPESGVDALYQLATGGGASWPGGSIPAVDTGWRENSLPIIVQISDAPNNSDETYGTVLTGTASREQALQALDVIEAKVVVVISQDYIESTMEEDHLDFVNATGAVVPPEAFGSSGECLTGINGEPVAPDAQGDCPLLFHIASSGEGLGTSIVEGIVALINYAGMDIDARVENEPGNQDAEKDAVDAVNAFIDRIVPNADPDNSTGCIEGLSTVDRLGFDGIDDTFVDVLPGKRVCFDVIPKRNRTVQPAAAPQLFRARIDIWGDNATVLDSRQVWFVVPPKPPEPGEDILIG